MSELELNCPQSLNVITYGIWLPPPNNITFFQCIRSKKVASMNSTGDLPFKCGFFKEKALHSEHVGLSIKVRLVLWSLNVQKREVTSYGRMGRRVGTISKLDFYLGVVIPRGHSRVWIFGFYVLSSLPDSKQALSGPRYGSKSAESGEEAARLASVIQSQTGSAALWPQ